LDSVNNNIPDADGPFVLIGDPTEERLNSLLFKIRCKVCSDIFKLCPLKKNLEANLNHYLAGVKHAKRVDELVAQISGSALSTGCRGRPPVLSRQKIGNQVDTQLVIKSTHN
jgi:hypothetical protein